MALLDPRAFGGTYPRAQPNNSGMALARKWRHAICLRRPKRPRSPSTQGQRSSVVRRGAEPGRCAVAI